MRTFCLLTFTLLLLQPTLAQELIPVPASEISGTTLVMPLGTLKPPQGKTWYKFSNTKSGYCALTKDGEEPDNLVGFLTYESAEPSQELAEDFLKSALLPNREGYEKGSLRLWPSTHNLFGDTYEFEVVLNGSRAAGMIALTGSDLMFFLQESVADSSGWFTERSQAFKSNKPSSGSPSPPAPTPLSDEEQGGNLWVGALIFGGLILGLSSIINRLSKRPWVNGAMGAFFLFLFLFFAAIIAKSGSPVWDFILPLGLFASLSDRHRKKVKAGE